MLLEHTQQRNSKLSLQFKKMSDDILEFTSNLDFKSHQDHRGSSQWRIKDIDIRKKDSELSSITKKMTRVKKQITVIRKQLVTSYQESEITDLENAVRIAERGREEKEGEGNELREEGRKGEEYRKEMTMENEFGDKLEVMEEALGEDRARLRAMKREVEETKKGLIERHDQAIAQNLDHRKMKYVIGEKKKEASRVGPEQAVIDLSNKQAVRDAKTQLKEAILEKDEMGQELKEYEATQEIMFQKLDRERKEKMLRLREYT